MSHAPFFVNTEDGFVTDVIEGFDSQSTMWSSQSTMWKFHKNVRWAKPFSSFEEADRFMKQHGHDRYYAVLSSS